MIVHSLSPLNKEPALADLVASAITPAALFYVRSHGAVPALDAATHRLRVTGRVARPLDLSMQGLRARFAPRSVEAVLQCAGNRRSGLQSVAPTSGDPWSPGAIGNAVWTGASLAELLDAAGAELGPDAHVWFSSADTVEGAASGLVDGAASGDASFEVSIPAAKAATADVLIAWAMNDVPLLPEHGFPLRAVVPGFAGIRSAKWLRAITVADRPSPNAMQARDYRLVPPDATAATVDWSKGAVIDAMPLTSAICIPGAHATLAAGPQTARGYAIASDRAVTRVDVSADGGRTWVQATLAPRGPRAWTLWQAMLNLAAGDTELVVRAWDEAGQTQPSDPAELWNFKGYLNASWHRVPVRVG